MYNLARTDVRPITTQSIQETLDPFRSVYQLQSGNSYPWYGAKAYQPSFGKKKRKKQNNNKAVAYCIKNNRVVGVYKKPGRKGRYYFNGTKVIKGKKCYKLKSKANAALKKKRPRRRKSSSRSSSTYYYVIDGREKKQSSWKKGYSKTRSPTCNKYYNELTCRHAKAGCKWTGTCVNKFGQSRFGSPASKYNYTLAQYADNASTPTDHLLGKISGTSAYSYPTNTQNYHFYTQRTNNSGYGF